MMLIETCIAAGTHQVFLNSPTKSPFSYRSMANGPGVGVGVGAGVGAGEDVGEIALASADGVGAAGVGGRVGTAWDASGNSRAHGVTTGAAAIVAPPRACPVAATTPTASATNATAVATEYARRGRTRRAGGRCERPGAAVPAAPADRRAARPARAAARISTLTPIPRA